MSGTVQSKPSVIKRILFFLRFLEIRLRFVMILIVTALLVGYWDHIQNYVERWQRERNAVQHEGHDAAVESEFEYYCGMHPFVVRSTQGKCPICGMDLSQRKKGAAMEMPEGVLARVQASPDRIMQAGVQVEPVLYRLLAREVRSYGIVEAAETQVADVIARFPGRVEELLVNATGMPIKKGEPLARIYSPEFLQGTQEYMRALTNLKQVESFAEAKEADKVRARQFADSARKRLSLAGFTEAQLDAIAKDGSEINTVTLYSPVSGTIMKKNVVQGQTVEEGTAIFSIADLSSLWVQVQVIESDIGAIHSGMPVEVTSVAWPGEIFYGTVDFFYPEVDPSSRSLKVRVSVDNLEGKLRPGMYVNAVMRSPLGQYGSPEEVSMALAANVAPAAALPATLPTTSKPEAQAYLASLADGAQYYTCTMDPEVVGDKPGDCPVCKMTLVSRTKGEVKALASAEHSEISLPTSKAEDAAHYLSTLADGATYYTCSMDPQVVSDKVGECPICGMNLEMQTKLATNTLVGLQGPLIGSYDEWAEGYTCPMHPDELSDNPGICIACNCKMEMTQWRVQRILSVPETAVIDTGNHKVVYVESSPGLFDARAVTLGARTGAYYSVLDGLVLGQRIVTRGAFLIDAEARLNPAASGLSASAHNH